MSDFKAHGEESIFQEFKGLFIGGAVIVLLIGIASIAVFGFARRNQVEFADGEKIDIVREFNPSIGPSDSPVTFVYFTDMQCPACKAQHAPLTQLKDKYSDRVQFVYKQYPVPALHPYANSAAKAALAVNQVDSSKYLEFVDVVFANQSQLNNQIVDTWAQNLGIDMDSYIQIKNDSLTEQKINQDKKDIDDIALPASKQVPSVQAKNAGRPVGTPTMLVYKDGELYDWWTGSLSEVEMGALIDSLLAQ
jgi:thiol-disulfide isomerase/thioredoxin